MPDKAGPALPAGAMVQVVRAGLIGFTAAELVPHRLIVSACYQFSAPGGQAQAPLGQIAAFGAEPPVVGGQSAGSRFGGTVQGVASGIRFVLAGCQQLFDQLRIVLADPDKPRPDDSDLIARHRWGCCCPGKSPMRVTATATVAGPQNFRGARLGDCRYCRCSTFGSNGSSLCRLCADFASCPFEPVSHDDLPLYPGPRASG